MISVDAEIIQEGSMKHFFVSYNSADRQWAEWIAWQLEKVEYTTVLQAWDFRPGSNFVLEMQRAARGTERIIAVLSQAYLDALYTQSEWAAAFARDPTGEKGTLLPVRVRECDLEGLLPQIIYVDLVGLDEAVARDALLAGVRRERAKPTVAPDFPEIVPRSVPEQPYFPGALRPMRKSPLAELLAALTSGLQLRGFYAEFGRIKCLGIIFWGLLVIVGTLWYSYGYVVHPTPTAIAIQPTDTLTPRPTYTQTPTDTPMPTPTDTLTPTSTPVPPTDTPTPVSPTDTPVLPTATPKAAPSTSTPIPAASPAVEHFEKGFDYFQQEMWDEAIAEFQEAIRLDPKFSVAYLGLGYSYVRKMEFEKAIEALEAYLQLEPSADDRKKVAADIQQMRDILASQQAAVGPCCQPLQPGKGAIWLENWIGETVQVDIGANFYEVPPKVGDTPGCLCPQLDPGHYTFIGKTGRAEGRWDIEIVAGQIWHQPLSIEGY